MRIAIVLFSVMLAVAASADMPDWYKRDIAHHLQNADAVIIYRVKSVELQSKKGAHFSYRIETETLQTLKGQPPKGECYFIHTEGEWASPYKVGKEAIVILGTKYTGECGAIESGYGAPATEEYVSHFKSIIG